MLIDPISLKNAIYPISFLENAIYVYKNILCLYPDTKLVGGIIDPISSINCRRAQMVLKGLYRLFNQMAANSYFSPQ